MQAKPPALPPLNPCSPAQPGLPQVHSALLRWLTGSEGAGIQLASHPLPVLTQEQVVRIGQAAGKSYTVLHGTAGYCMVVHGVVVLMGGGLAGEEVLLTFGKWPL